MINKKIILLILSISFLISNCGYTPQYAKNKNPNFSIEVLDISGDRDFNNLLQSKLKRYSKTEENQIKKFKIYAKSKYEKNTSLKNSSGVATEYELKINVNFKIVFEEKEKNIIIKETFNIKKMDDAFEEKNYERTIKSNFADIIQKELISYLSRL